MTNTEISKFEEKLINKYITGNAESRLPKLIANDG